jgi:hypothetical protein
MARSVATARFAKTACERIRIDGGGYRRDHLRGLAQRVEVADREVRIVGSKSNLLQTLTAAAGAAAYRRRSQFCSEVAEGVGFEPTRSLHPCRFSRPVL